MSRLGLLALCALLAVVAGGSFKAARRRSTNPS
jgi:hypothetical protein